MGTEQARTYRIYGLLCPHLYFHEGVHRCPVGTLLKLKIESTTSGAANEKDVFTTVSGAWATYSWDFVSGDPPIYNVITPMFGYGTPNNASAEATFLFDDIQISDGTLSLDRVNRIEGLRYFPNPARENFTIASANDALTEITIFDIRGTQVAQLRPNAHNVQIDLSAFAPGLYIARVATAAQVSSIKLVVE